MNFPKKKEELPEIYEHQSIKKRNEIVEEYINSLDKKSNAKDDDIEDDDNDPFSSAQIGKLKKIEKEKFTPQEIINLNRYKIKSEQGKRKYNNNIDNLTDRKDISNNSKRNISQKRTHSQRKSREKKNLFYNKYEKRNNTAKAIKNKQFNLKNTNVEKSKRVYSTLNSKRLINNQHNFYSKLINDKNNLYSINWANKILNKNYGYKIGMNGFINGVPNLIINNKNKKILTKKELKERLNKLQNNKNIINILKDKEYFEEDNIPNEILSQFNTNHKNFFKFRKDIIEEPEEEDDLLNSINDNINKENNNINNRKNNFNQVKKKDIEFPLIYKYFKNNNN